MKKRIFTRAIYLVSFVSLFTDIASEMLYPVMPVYLRSIGFSVLLIGILEGIAEATAGLSKGYFGHWSDRIGQRVPFIRAGYALSAISKPMMAVLTFPVWIFFARTLDRFGKGIRTSARDALLSDETTPEYKGRVFGFHRAMDTVGAAIGPVIALIFLYFNPGQYKWMFIIAFLPGMIAILLTFLLKDKAREITGKLQDPTGHPAERKAAPGFLSYLSYRKRAPVRLRMLMTGMLLFTIFNSSDAFLLLMVREQGLSDSSMIGVYVFYNMVYALFSYPVGILADRFGMKTMLILGLFIFAGVYFLMGFAQSLLFFGGLFFFYGIYAACTEGISKALISNMADKKDTATALGFYNSLASICTLAASSLAGLLWFYAGPKAMFMISGTGVALAAIFLLMVLRPEKSA